MQRKTPQDQETPLRLGAVMSLDENDREWFQDKMTLAVMRGFEAHEEKRHSDIEKRIGSLESERRYQRGIMAGISGLLAWLGFLK